MGSGLGTGIIPWDGAHHERRGEKKNKTCMFFFRTLLLVDLQRPRYVRPEISRVAYRCRECLDLGCRW